MKKIFLLAFGAGVLCASGFKIPEQSTDSLSMAAANIAKSYGADAAYLNPAGMAWLDGGHSADLLLSHFKIPSITFKQNDSSYKSDSYNTFGGAIHFVTPDYYNLRFGINLVSPMGASIEWQDLPQKITRGFEVRVLELNPSLSYRINDYAALGAGFSLFYSKGKVKNKFTSLSYQAPNGSLITPERYTDGDSYDAGYNLAISLRPFDGLYLAATYRSKVDLSFKGETSISGFPPVATAQTGGVSMAEIFNYKGQTNVRGIMIPASITLAGAYDFSPNATLMLALERNFWSQFKGYEFKFSDLNQYQSAANGDFYINFVRPTNREFKDTNTYRAAFAYSFSPKLRASLGFAYDSSMAAEPDSVSFEIPDTTAFVYSFGIAYSLNQNFDLGAGYIYQHRKAAKSNTQVLVQNGQTQNIAGEFASFGVQIFGLGLKYSF